MQNGQVCAMLIVSKNREIILEEKVMDGNKRPDSMARITTKAQADAFIAAQVADVRAQVGDKKVLLALSGGVDSSAPVVIFTRVVPPIFSKSQL